MIRILDTALTVAACAVLVACASTPPAAATKAARPASTAQEAVTNLAPASGSLVSGKLVLRPMGDGVHISGEVGGLKPGDVRGFHIHEKGDCSAADASSAGGHFNPDAVAHGAHDAPVHHTGDMPNMRADAQGVATVDGLLAREATLGDGSSHDILGRGLIIHADPDDYVSQPTGNAGARLACGVIGSAQ